MKAEDIPIVSIEYQTHIFDVVECPRKGKQIDWFRCRECEYLRFFTEKTVKCLYREKKKMEGKTFQVQIDYQKYSQTIS